MSPLAYTQISLPLIVSVGLSRYSRSSTLNSFSLNGQWLQSDQHHCRGVLGAVIVVVVIRLLRGRG
jgi:hypothetical protein